MRLLPLLVASLVLAGCAGSPDAPPATEPQETGGDEPLAVNNTPPQASLHVSLVFLEAQFNITLSDAEGDNLTWTLDADGDGQADGNGTGSGLFNHTYAGPGNFTAVLEASDGANSTTVSQAVEATSPIEPLPGQHAEGEFVAGGMTLIGCFGDILGVGFPAELDGIFYASFEIEPHTVGYDFTAAVAAATAQDSPGFAFLDADRAVLTSGFLSTHGAGTVPEKATTGIWWTCAGGVLTGTFESTPPS